MKYKIYYISLKRKSKNVKIITRKKIFGKTSSTIRQTSRN